MNRRKSLVEAESGNKLTLMPLLSDHKAPKTAQKNRKGFNDRHRIEQEFNSLPQPNSKSATMINFFRSSHMPETRASLSPYRQKHNLQKSSLDNHYGINPRAYTRIIATATKKINKLVGVYDIDKINIRYGKYYTQSANLELPTF